MTLNCGVGMVALVAPDVADQAVAVLAEHDVRAWVAGEVTPRSRGRAPGRHRLGWWAQHPGWSSAGRLSEPNSRTYVREQPGTR